MRYYIISGEASGDLHGSNLMKAIKERDKNAEFRFWGGDLMAAQGGRLVKHYRELAFMGFLEVLVNIRTIIRNLKFCKKDILKFDPDALILIDYPGFNLRIAEYAKENGVEVHYYISPQIWAWKQGRVKKIKRDVKHMYCILPFEKDFYKKHHVDVHFVGHPLIDAIENSTSIGDFRKVNELGEKPIIALLPGSRKQEIAKMLVVMAKVRSNFSDYQFVIAGAPSQELTYYRKLVGNEVPVLQDQTYELLRNSKAALVTSGTATLETALFNVPEVVCYKANWVSYQIAKLLVKVDYISLVNLIMKKESVRELIQNDFNQKNVTSELGSILEDEQKRKEIIQDYKQLESLLGGQGASRRTAELIVSSFTA